MSAPPLQIDIYDKNFVLRGRIGNPKFATVIPRHNAVGTCTVGVPSSHLRIPALTEPGARLWVKDEFGAHLMSGYIKNIRGTGPALAGQFEVDIDDDFSMLNEVLGWVQPAQPITSQGIAGDNWELTGPAETVLKTVMQLNAVNRLGLPLTIATDLGRGTSIKGDFRFHPIFDRLFPVLDGNGFEAAGLGVSIQQSGAGLVLDVYVPRVYPRLLTEASGIITSWSWAQKAPTASRVVVGGQGVAQARVFRHYEDLAREAEIGRKIERFRDARDVTDVIDLPARGQQTLDEGASKSGLAVGLNQTKNFRYGKIKVGDQIAMEVGPGVVVTDILREATLSWTADAGWAVSPKVGERSDDSDRMLAKTLRTLARVLSNQNRT